MEEKLSDGDKSGFECCGGGQCGIISSVINFLKKILNHNL